MKESYTTLAKPADPGQPLIFAFHGTGGDERQFFGLTQEMFPGAGVVSPRGDVREHGAARFFRRMAEGLYDMEDLARATAKMGDFIAAWSTDHAGPVYGFGYSNGANILASVLMARPGLFDRAGLLHPLIPWDPAPVPGLAGRDVLITAGRRDPICPWPKSERLIAWVAAQGAQVATHVHEGGHELVAGELDALASTFAPEAVG